MKCQILFSEKKYKRDVISLSPAELTQRLVNNIASYFSLYLSICCFNMYISVSLA